MALDDIVLRIPDEKTPGYWQRQEQTVDMQIALYEAMATLKRIEKQGDNADPGETLGALKGLRSAQNTMVDYILNHVVEPDDPEQARAEIRGLSEDDFNAVLSYIREGQNSDENPTASAGGNGSE